MDKAYIVNICRHRINSDGKGINTLVILQGCPLRCEYCFNKESWEKDNATLIQPEELLNKVQIDNLYFTVTNGGITFGGGEPLVYSKFIYKFIQIAPKHWNINLETSLFAETEHLERIAKYIKLFIIDIKDINNEIFRSYTGKNNNIVLNNLKWLAKNYPLNNVIIRIPNIPNYNTVSDVHNSIDFISNMGFKNINRFTYNINKNKMVDRKWVCNLLKKIRVEVANHYSINYTPKECNNLGFCKGNCPTCETELKELTKKCHLQL